MDYLPKVALILGILWYAANLGDWLYNKLKPEASTEEEDPFDTSDC